MGDPSQEGAIKGFIAVVFLYSVTSSRITVSKDDEGTISKTDEGTIQPLTIVVNSKNENRDRDVR
ncbi:MAG: hypothetical protein HRT91_02110 [Piscirickettsiaceae bacterium]|nr:hypothetical protein [Piscirickettsiaceae bacterium]